MIKKRQYYMSQYQLDDLYEKNGKLMVDFSIENAVTTSETLMYYILNEKIRKNTKKFGKPRKMPMGIKRTDYLLSK